MRKITSLIGCLLLIISLSSISINAAERTEPRAESLSVVNSTLLIEGEYTHHGSVVVRDNGCLVIVGTFTVLQDYAYQYSIEVRNNGTLRVVEHGILKSNYPLLIKTENTAYIELNNGSVELSAGKLELTDSIVTIMNSKLNCTLLSGTSSTIDVVASTLSSSITELNKVLFSATNSVLTSCLNATDSACTLFNVTLPSAIATGTTAISIYRVLSIYVRDVIDVPVGGATVHIKHLLNDSVYQTGVTSHKGKFETYALSDIITATGEQFLGNYRISAFYNGLTTTTAIALPHYQVYSKLEDVVNIKSAVLRFEVPLISSFYSAGRDIIIAENSTKILENSEYAKDGETYTYVQDGNILVKNNATLIIRKNTVLNIIQSSQRRYFISVENQGRLIIEGNSST
ncbi:MAG: hypothetical protein QME47_08195, partial [Candidatus Thermoplasmatota archaeon]|nr:hypothetical protein [Candidatus Thermoplasmatota archaeon]